MNIKYMEENFINQAKISIDDDFPASIILQHSDHWDKSRWGHVIDVKKEHSKITLVVSEEYCVNKIYKFTDLSIFDNVNEVVFEINGVEIDDFEFADISWSDREFCFETDFNEKRI